MNKRTKEGSRVGSLVDFFKKKKGKEKKEEEKARSHLSLFHINKVRPYRIGEPYLSSMMNIFLSNFAFFRCQK